MKNLIMNFFIKFTHTLPAVLLCFGEEGEEVINYIYFVCKKLKK